MGFGDSFMDFAHGFNRTVRGVYHEGAGAVGYWWNGGDNPSVDNADCFEGRMSAAAEYEEGENWSRSGQHLMGQGIGGMWDNSVGAAVDGISGWLSEPNSDGGGGASGAPPSYSDDGAGGAGGGGPGPYDEMY